jgi:GWxTD domain-containing protein
MRPLPPFGAPRVEHYERIAYANEHFSNSKSGWETGREHIYIE